MSEQDNPQNVTTSDLLAAISRMELGIRSELNVVHARIDEVTSKKNASATKGGNGQKPKYLQKKGTSEIFLYTATLEARGDMEPYWGELMAVKAEQEHPTVKMKFEQGIPLTDDDRKAYPQIAALQDKQKLGSQIQSTVDSAVNPAVPSVPAVPAVPDGPITAEEVEALTKELATMTKDELVATAADNGVLVSTRWGEDRIRSTLIEAATQSEPAE